MANSSRLNKNRNGQMLIPMNVEGGAWQDGFFNSTKGIAGIVILFGTVGLAAWISGLYVGWVLKLILFLMVLFIDQLILRYIIFEEKYYHRMYKKMKVYEVSTPAVFWNIAHVRDTEDGAILMYGDGKVGIIIRLERDTITGKDSEFREMHYDAMSDFYKELNLKNLKFVQMNLMEQAGKDPRIQKLDELGARASNPNISKIIDAQVGHIKKVTRATLFESDYFLVYTDDMTKSDAIAGEAIDCIYKLMEGAFVGFEVLNSSQVIELVREQYGVKYFDSTEATVNMYKNFGLTIHRALDIKEVIYTDGTSDKVDADGNNRISMLTGYVKRGAIKPGEWSVRETLQGNIVKKNKKNTEKITRFEDLIEKGKNRIEKEQANMDELLFGEMPEFKPIIAQESDESYSEDVGNKGLKGIGKRSINKKVNKKKDKQYEENQVDNKVSEQQSIQMNTNFDEWENESIDF